MILLRTFLALICFFLLSLSVFAQNVTITPDGITPALSSAYQRLTYDAIVALDSPHDGDIVYDVTFKCMRLYNGTKWVRLLSDEDLNIPSLIGWSAGGTGTEEGQGVVVDSSGNVFVTGYFAQTAVFGDTSVISVGGLDMFLAKYNNNGTLLWVRTAGGPDNDAARDIAIGKDQSVYITGGFQTSASFGATNLVSAGLGDIFLAKYDADGNLTWVRQAGSVGDETAFGVTVDSTNNAYITGYFVGMAGFSSALILSVGVADIFIAKYNSSGTLTWVQRAGDAYTDIAYKIAVDKNGFVYITGYFNIGTTFGASTIYSAGENDIFIAKYNPVTSSWMWAQRAGGNINDSAEDITVDVSGNLYITGYFANTATIGSTSITAPGGIHWDAFVAKFDTDGILQWVTRGGGVFTDVGRSITLDKQNNVYITGHFSDTATFGTSTIFSKGDTDIFIAKYTNNGVFEWIQTGGNTLDDSGAALTSDSKNNVFVTGYFRNKIKLGNSHLTSLGIGDVFVTRIVD